MKLYLAIVTEPNCPVYQNPTVHKFTSIEERDNFYRKMHDDMRSRSKGGGFVITASGDRGEGDSICHYRYMYCNFMGQENRILERVDSAEVDVEIDVRVK